LVSSTSAIYSQILNGVISRYCIPTDSARPISNAEVDFFNWSTGPGEENQLHYLRRSKAYLCNSISVPVIAIFTKYDGLETKIFNDLEDQLGFSQARLKMQGQAKRVFTEHYLGPIMAMSYPPAAYVGLKGASEAKSIDRLILIHN
jgi:hypothetical protein